jgi:ketosteroid isomerase-like protein
MNAAADIERLEEQLRQAMLTSDCAALDQLLSDELVFTNQSGLRLSKQDDLAAHASRTLEVERLEFSDQDIRVLGTTAIVCVVTAVQGRYLKQPFSGTFAYTRLWLQSAGQWQIEAAHCSPAES